MMRLLRWCLALSTLASVPAMAAGSGAGAGGAGHQRAINMGLVPGEPGPPGAPNNPRPAPKPPAEGKGSNKPANPTAVH